MTRVLVTGATGQDGSYLIDQLAKNSEAIHAFARHGSAGIDTLRKRWPDVAIHQGDLLEGDDLAKVIEQVQPDEIYNLAGVSSVARSWEDPIRTADVCGVGAARILEAAWRQTQRSGTTVRVLQASSAEIYGDPLQVPQDETTPLRPRSPYGAAKAFAHQLVAVYRERGLHAVSAVLFNHESPRRSLTFVSRKITRAVAEIALGRRDALALGNLDARRDWGWAPDYVDAMVRALRHPEADDYVIATGNDHSVRDFVAAAFACVGVADWEPLVRVDPALVRPSDPTVLVGDAGKARTRLEWSPTLGFDDIVARMVDADLAELQRAG
jgi:GDPmannose 4,6-dehydratase